MCFVAMVLLAITLMTSKFTAAARALSPEFSERQGDHSMDKNRQDADKKYHSSEGIEWFFGLPQIHNSQTRFDFERLDPGFVIL